MIPELARHAEKLFYFFEIINEGSLQACGRKLGISASSLSYTIKELERVCGVNLLKRSKKGVEPSEAGLQLYQLCRSMYRDMENVQLQMKDSALKTIHRVRLGTFPSIAIYFWPLILGELKKSNHLSMSIVTGRSKDVLESLIRREIDVAITVECFANAQIIKHQLYQDYFSFYVSNKKNIPPLNEQVLYYIPDAQDHAGKKIKQHLQGMSFNFKEECEMDSFEVISDFVKNGHGVGVLPNRVALTLKKSIKKIVSTKLPVDFGRHRFFLSYRDDLDLSQKDLDFILEAAKKAVNIMQMD